MQWINSPLTIEKGKHWDIWFEEIDQMSEVSQVSWLTYFGNLF